MTYNLVADIGGTNARFALVEQGSATLLEAKTLVCANYQTIVSAIRFYLDSVPYAQPENAVLAVAGALTSRQIKMTNHVWCFDICQTREQLKLKKLKVINDFTALALALPCLPNHSCYQIGAGQKHKQQTKALIGPGTGLGVSGVVMCHKHWVPLQSEGGHISYAPFNELEITIINILQQNKQSHKQPLSAESLISGYGLSTLYEAFSQLRTGQAVRLKAKQIIDKAIIDDCKVAQETLNTFCAILGSVASNLALTLGARGGVYIGGGIVPRFLDYFAQSDFRTRFETHHKFANYLAEIPTYVITNPYPALIGATQACNAWYDTLGMTSPVIK